MRSQSAASKPGRSGRRYLPHAFTEHGAIMLANVLNTSRAAEVSVYLVRAFVRLRDMLANYKDLVLKSSLMLSANLWYFWNVFYGLQALLLTKDTRRSTHSGIIAAFNRQYIRSGNIPNVRRYYGRSIAAR